MQTGVARPIADRMWISLVDDDILLRRSLQLLLRSSDYEVRAYATATALLADAKSRMSACLITDRQLAGMDGFTLLRRLRDRGWKNPAILVTAFNTSALQTRAARAGFHSILIKPLRDQKVLEAVRDAVNHGRQAETA